MDSNDIDIKWKKIKRLYPANIKKRGKSAYSTEQVQTILNNVTDLRSEVLIHILASTDCRIGEQIVLRALKKCGLRSPDDKKEFRNNPIIP